MGNQMSPAALDSASDAEVEVVISTTEKECNALADHIASCDAETVRKATKGMATNEAALIGILCNRTKAQLDRIDLAYHKKYEMSLLDVVRKDVSGDFGKMMTHALLPIPEYGEAILSAAMDGVGCNESMLIDLAMTKTNAELAAIKKQYEARNGNSLLDKLKSNLRGDFEKLMVGLYMGERSESTAVDEGLAAQQAKKLYDAGVGKRMGTDEDVFIDVLLHNGRPQVQAIKAAYEKNHGMSLLKAIEKELKGDIRRGLLALLHPSAEAYTASALYKAFEGVGTDDSRVCYLLGGTDKKLLGAVAAWFLEAYGQSLNEAIKDELSGDFEDAALAWVSGAEPTNGMQYVCEGPVPGDAAGRRERAKALLQQRGNLADFVAQQDATRIRAACKGMGTEDDTLIAIICGRTKEHLKRVDLYYHSLYEMSLLDQIHKECSGDYKRLLEYAVSPEDVFDALSLKEATDGMGTDESLLIESLACRSNARIKAARAKFGERFGRPLIDILNSDLSGDTKAVIMELIKAERSEAPADADLADTQADELHAAGVGRMGTDEAVFIRILTKSSFEQIAAIKAAYEKRHGTSLERAIAKETGGKLEDTLIALTQTPEDYYSARMKKAFAGVGTDEGAVARILGGHNKHEIARIDARYLERYGQTILEALKKETSGRFRVACLTWLTTEDPLAGANQLQRALAGLPPPPKAEPPAQAEPEPIVVAKPFVAPAPEPPSYDAATGDDGDDSDGDSNSDDGKAAVAAMPGTPEQHQKMLQLQSRKKKAMRVHDREKVARLNEKIRRLKAQMAGRPVKARPPPPQVVHVMVPPPVVYYAPPPGYGYGPPGYGPPGYGPPGYGPPGYGPPGHGPPGHGHGRY